MKKIKDARLQVAKQMPPLSRTIPGQPYSHAKDEVLQWIAKRPSLLNYLFDKVRASGYLVYNSDTEKWQGVNYEADIDD